MQRILTRTAVALLASAILAAHATAQTRDTAPPKERPKAEQPKEASNPREIAKKAAHFESLHRDRIARIDRLIEIFTKKGDRAKVAELQALREQQLKRHDNAMAGFRKQLGNDWGRLEKELKEPKKRARDVRDEHANENEREREARKAGKEAKPKEDAAKGERPKDKPGGKN